MMDGKKLPTFRKGEKVIVSYPWKRGAPRISAKIDRVGETQYHVDGHGSFYKSCNRHTGCYSWLEKKEQV